MKRNTKVVGDRSEVRVLSAFVESGYNVSIPFGENHRYDFIAVYCPDTDEVYVIPEADACIRPYLRIDAPKNNMKKLIRWASDYAFGSSRPRDSALELPLNDPG